MCGKRGGGGGGEQEGEEERERERKAQKLNGAGWQKLHELNSWQQAKQAKPLRNHSDLFASLTAAPFDIYIVPGSQQKESLLLPPRLSTEGTRPELTGARR